MASKPLGSLTFAEIFGRMGDLPDLVTVSASTTVETALKTMASTRVSAVCVTSHVDPRKIVAVVGFHDAVSYVASRYGKEDPEQLLGATLDSLLTLNTSEESYRVYERDVNDLIGDTLKAFTAKLHRALWVSS
jgi:CBS domain-containing protein